MLYIATVGAVLGIVWGSDHSPFQVLLAIPYVALGVTLLIAQHNLVIGAIAKFCHCELSKHLQDAESASKHTVPIWETSKTLKQYWPEWLVQLNIAHAILILLPCFIAVFYNTDKLWFQTDFTLVTWGAIAASIAIVIIITRDHMVRRQFYTEYQNFAE